MKGSSLSSQYREFAEDAFPARLEISFHDEGGKRVTFHYEKATWVVAGERKGLRYGENPDQAAALYRPLDGNLALAGGEPLAADGSLVSSAELLQSGKHPGKTNLTDVDSGLSILRHLASTPACAVMKHNNPSGVARAASLGEAYRKAFMADRIAAFGGAVVVNRELDPATARAIADSYCEVVAAPEYAEGAFGILAARKNLRIIRIPEIARLERWAPARVLDFRSLVDGGLVVQESFRTRVASVADFRPAIAVRDGREYRVEREPDAGELEDMLFGWLVETGVTSNSVIYVKDGATVGIGTGEQDRVGVAEIARDKAYRKLEDRLCFERTGTPFGLLPEGSAKAAIREEAAAVNGGLRGSVMVSDAFFPFRDGIDAGLREGVRAVVQPGGSLRDFEAIEACNEAGAAMKFTGQRCFRH